MGIQRACQARIETWNLVGEAQMPATEDDSDDAERRMQQTILGE